MPKLLTGYKVTIENHGSIWLTQVNLENECVCNMSSASVVPQRQRNIGLSPFNGHWSGRCSVKHLSLEKTTFLTR